METPHWSYPLYRMAWSGSDMLFPPRCGGCGKSGARWCSECQKTIPLLDEPVCDSCGIPIPQAGVCRRCRQEPPPFRALRSWAAFDSPIQPALHKLNYRRDLGLGDALAAPFSEFAENLKWPFGVVVPVPLGKKRQKERGYNQVALIARPFSLLLGRSYHPAALQRRHDTRSQVGLSAGERRNNVRNAFVADPRLVQGKTVLVMDDVATTGATLSSCSEALLQAGARDVFALTVARALPHHGLNLV